MFNVYVQPYSYDRPYWPGLNRCMMNSAVVCEFEIGTEHIRIAWPHPSGYIVAWSHSFQFERGCNIVTSNRIDGVGNEALD